MRVMSSFCSALIMRLAIERKRPHRGQVVEGEEHRLAMRAMPVTRPRRHAENVLLLPLELLLSNLRPTRSRSDLIDDASGMANPGCWSLDQIELSSHGRHDRAVGKRILVMECFF